jgi:cell division protein FtsA
MSSLAQRLLVRERGQPRNPVLAALDIGSSKITCLIGRRADAEDDVPVVAGVGVQASRGVKAGAAADLDALERSIRLAVEQAERAAGMAITDVVVGVSGPDLRSDVVRARLALGGKEVSAQHVAGVRAAALESFNSNGRDVLHASLLGYSVDGTSGIRDPLGMFADALTASFLIVSAPTAGLRNILQCISRAHLTVGSVVAAPYAAGLSVLVEDEAEQGAMVIDFGAGVTSAAAFMEGRLMHVETLPMGGARATSDLAQGLGTTSSAAERMKVLHGAVGLTEIDALEQVEGPRLGPDGRLEAATCARAELAQILRPRFEEILELMDMRLSKASSGSRPLPRRIVMTGGSSLIPSLRELAEDVFRAPVRLARPTLIRGLGDNYSSPAFASAAGLLRWGLVGLADAARSEGDKAGVRGGAEPGAGLFRRVGVWLKENF